MQIEQQLLDTDGFHGSHCDHVTRDAVITRVPVKVCTCDLFTSCFHEINCTCYWFADYWKVNDVVDVTFCYYYVVSELYVRNGLSYCLCVIIKTLVVKILLSHTFEWSKYSQCYELRATSSLKCVINFSQWQIVAVIGLFLKKKTFFNLIEMKLK